MLNVKLIWDQPLSTYAKSFEKLTFLTSWYPRVRVRIGGVRNLSFSKNFAYVLNGWPLSRITRITGKRHASNIKTLTNFLVWFLYFLPFHHLFQFAKWSNLAKSPRPPPTAPSWFLQACDTAVTMVNSSKGRAAYQFLYTMRHNDPRGCGDYY